MPEAALRHAFRHPRGKHERANVFPEIIDTRPLRRAVDDGLNWVVRNWGGDFEAAAYPLLMLLNAIEDLLLATPWWLIIAILVGIAWLATRTLASCRQSSLPRCSSLASWTCGKMP